MRKFILIGILLIVAIGAGFASVRLRRQQVSFPPHTITYRLTSYDEAGNVTRTSTIIRKVAADGTWKHTQINPDGPVIYSSGKLRREVTSQIAEASLPEHLHFKYVEVKGSDSVIWTSPQLQDALMFIELRPDGSKISRLEAVEVTLP
ncbi:MAG: hypothetical protein ACREBG_10875 [Pyrinomonadaceae bacterium]